MFLSVALAALALSAPPEHPKPFEFKDGDRIVWLGNTLVEREQRYGYWETALIAANADKKITLRNLGWSGDTVYGDARAGFDNAAKGFERMVNLTLELKPTVIFISYGTNESFEGKAGLPKFEKGLEKLLDALKPTGARVVLFSPLPFEKSQSLPNPDERNRQLEAYRGVLQKVAVSRGAYFADINGSHGGTFLVPLTENGIHLTERGYALTAESFVRSLGIDTTPKDGTSSSSLSGVSLPVPLRKAVVAKNELFFYRWRPQNETYLFGFRKHEQGKNGKEVAEFDPLVKKAEDEIDTLRKALMK